DFHVTGVQTCALPIFRAAMKEAEADPARIAGIGFDATCSLVVLGEAGSSLAVGPSEDPNRDIIVWMDHRAVGQAERINAAGHDRSEERRVGNGGRAGR